MNCIGGKVSAESARACRGLVGRMNSIHVRVCAKKLTTLDFSIGGKVSVKSTKAKPVANFSYRMNMVCGIYCRVSTATLIFAC